MPVFNAERFVASAIESILGQDFADYEFIAINDGSTDHSREVVAQYAVDDPRIQLFDQPNRGLIATLNRGLELARAPFIVRMDADDVSLPGRLRRQHEALLAREDLAVIGGFTQIIDEEGRPLRIGRYPTGRRDVAAFIERGSPVAHPAVTMRRSAVLSAGGYRNAFVHAEDYDLWLRLHDMGFVIDNLPFPVLGYRYHEASISMQHRRQQALGTFAARAAHQLRRRGQGDPIGPDTVVDDALAAKLSEQLSTDFQVELLEVLYSDLSIADERTLADAQAVLARLPRTTTNRGGLARLHLRCAHGLMRNHQPASAVRCGLAAFRASPAAASAMLWLWLRKLLASRFS